MGVIVCNKRAYTLKPTHRCIVLNKDICDNVTLERASDITGTFTVIVPKGVNRLSMNLDCYRFVGTLIIQQEKPSPDEFVVDIQSISTQGRVKLVVSPCSSLTICALYRDYFDISSIATNVHVKYGFNKLYTVSNSIQVTNDRYSNNRISVYAPGAVVRIDRVSSYTRVAADTMVVGISPVNRFLFNPTGETVRRIYSPAKVVDPGVEYNIPGTYLPEVLFTKNMNDPESWVPVLEDHPPVFFSKVDCSVVGEVVCFCTKSEAEEINPELLSKILLEKLELTTGLSQGVKLEITKQLVTGKIKIIEYGL